MYSEVVWVLVSSGTQVHPQTILEPDYLSDYLPVFYDYAKKLASFIIPKLKNVTASEIFSSEIHDCLNYSPLHTKRL